MKIYFPMISLLFFILTSNVNCLFKNVVSRFYCNEDNCYSILGISERASIEDIRSSYFRQLKNLKENYDIKKKKKIVQAYNVLINKRSRKYYDYYLKNPDSIINIVNLNLLFLFKLFKVILSIILIALFGILIQYINNKYEQKNILHKFSKHKDFRKKVQERIMLKYPQYKTYEIKEKQKIEKSIEIEIAQELYNQQNKYNNQNQGKVNIFKIIIIIKQIICFITWIIKWVIKYYILNCEYDESDKIFITRRCLNMSLDKWDALDDDNKKMLLKKELWVKEKKKEFLAEIKERERLEKISSAKYKKEKRMKKKGFSFNYND
ncbi:DnaJ protein, putative [Plasmodium yoelii]|uniref:DnaJ protein n=3 Tax=Plasmodium yoelii TaxID=5861 RepID=A0AAE9WV54_PLAYO|nr:DnaJ protein, putative [Plasmodium yoelii]WBY57154.1 DnaJ protein [Plasmodium yoelii yoelii]CDU17847.1 DnaJ protein, putative [Plasmodium yoelii]VTZ78264.1 DnaJ protein, putative [Plasmodium yoelii]|eukprot:XP_022812129.1 DnaJ protein, putative [Plasmodium yoelii]